MSSNKPFLRRRVSVGKIVKAEHSLIMIRFDIDIICIFGCRCEWYKIDLVSL